MNKELEALKLLEIEYDKLDYTIEIDNVDIITLLRKALEELEVIKSADGGLAWKALQQLTKKGVENSKSGSLNVQQEWTIINNYLLKAQAQEQELRELKCTALNYLSCVSNDIDQSLYGLDVAKALWLLCMKGSEE